MKPSPRDIGLLLLGAGVFIFSLVVLHFYLTQVLPESLRSREAVPTFFLTSTAH